MEIKPLDQTVKNLLETGFYKIPRFQRPYSWDRENVEDFWNDAIVADDPDYFIGSFVLYRSKSDADLFFIVDGQQRLTTITLLLAAIRDALQALAFKPLAVGVQRLIEREDVNSELRFVLDSETPYPYLQEQIQKFEDKGPNAAVGTEQEAIKSASEYLLSQIQGGLQAIDSDTTTDDRKKIEAKRKKLLTIRDKILRLQLISITLGNEDDAYLIFETLNTRGKDLTVSDLVKNHLTRLLKPANKAVDTTKDTWNKILELFYKSEAPINPNRFLHHSWLSRNPYTTEKKLFKDIKKSVNKSSAKDFLSSLVSDAQLYRQLLDPTSYKWKKDEREIADSIRALNVFRVVQPVPMMLSLLREYRNKDITLKQVRRTFQSMENFHVQFTGVTSQRTGGGTAFMYALSARQLLEVSSKDEKSSVLGEFVTKLRERVPSYEEFEAAFGEIWFTEEDTRQRPLVRYLLRRIDQYRRKGTPVDYDLMTVEHIAPQSDGAAQSVQDAVGIVGNLLFVPEALNKKLKNKSFKDKIEVLRDSDVPLDNSLKTANKWDEAAIKERTKNLAKLCYEDIFKV